MSVRKGSTPAEVLSVTNTGGFVRSLEVFDKQVYSQDDSNYKLVRYNDLAYNPSRINVGSVALCKLHEGGAVSPMYVVVRCRETLLPQYLLYFLKSEIGRQHIVHRCVGAVRAMLRFSDLEQIEIPLPPLSEQERIARILDDADSLRRIRSEADRRTRDLTQALFAQSFGTSPVAQRGLTSCCLGELGRVVTGNTPSRSDAANYGTFIEWVKTDNIDADRGIVTKAEEALSELGASRGRVVPRGSVLVTCIAGSLKHIGDAAITDRPVAINQQINAIIPSDPYRSDFVWALVGFLRPVVQGQTTGNMTRMVTKSALERVPAIKPTEPSQTQFCAHIAATRGLRDAQAACQQRLEDLHQSLLSRAFAGEL